MEKTGINLNIISILVKELERFVKDNFNVKNARLDSVEFERDYVLLNFTCEKQDLEVKISYDGWVKNVKQYPEPQ